MTLRVTPCFRCRMLRVGAVLLPVALATSLLPARDTAFAVRALAAWLLAYAVMCTVWWSITQLRKARRRDPSDCAARPNDPAPAPAEPGPTGRPAR